MNPPLDFFFLIVNDDFNDFRRKVKARNLRHSMGTGRSGDARILTPGTLDLDGDIADDCVPEDTREF